MAMQNPRDASVTPEQKTLRLLILAAKAAGFARMVLHHDVPHVSPSESGENFIAWNPRVDDGDSRRLQVACQIEADCDNLRCRVSWWSDRINRQSLAELHNGDPLGKMRELVLSAAAAIGEAMP